MDNENKNYWYDAENNRIYEQGGTVPSGTSEITWEQAKNIINRPLTDAELYVFNTLNAEDLITRIFERNITVNLNSYLSSDKAINHLVNFLSNNLAESDETQVFWYNSSYAQIQVQLSELREVLESYYTRMSTVITAYNNWLAGDRLIEFSEDN